MSPTSYSQRSDQKFNMKTSLQSCMGLVDGLCCASLKNVHSEETLMKKEGLRKYFTSYDLSYLNSNAAGSSVAGYSSSDVQEEEGDPKEQAGDIVRKDTYRMSNKSTDKQKESTMPFSQLHTVVPNSLLPRDYGISNDNDTVDGSNSVLRTGAESSESPVSTTPSRRRRRRRPRGYGDMNSWASCTSCPQLTFDMSDDDDEDDQPRTLSASDTYTTVSLSQSYIWEEDEEEDVEYHHPFHQQVMVESEEDCFTLSSADSVFRRAGDEPSTIISETTQETPSKRAASFVSTKTHEAYQYLLRMKPQNYMHDVSSSSEEEDDDDDLPENANQNDNRCGLFLHYNEDECEEQ